MASLPYLAEHRFQFSGLTDDAQQGLDRMPWQLGEQRTYAQATDFLVIGKAMCTGMRSGVAEISAPPPARVLYSP
jgi:hypothetical protein